ncbi:MAG: FtsH protease activity modulator HflK [Dehalococcoidia bacterium]|nr:FtsH protease activity modulator HflK [Dehalococcoidia bacterium]
MRQPRPQPEVDLDQLLRGIREFFQRTFGGVGGGVGTVVLGALALALLVWLATGFYRVEAGEQGVVRQFGKFNSLAQPGLNWRLPQPITSLVKVNVQRIRTAEIGFRSASGGGVSRDLPESLMLTTDNSIIEAQMVIQYTVSNPKDFVFNVQDPEVVLHTSGEVALRSIVGRTPLNTILTVGRGVVEADTRVFLENLLDTYGTGITITELKLQAVDPPDQVKDAFQEVVRALEDETRLENHARAYFADKIPRAQGQVQVSVRDAAGFYQTQIERSRGEGNRFLALLGEYRKAPQVTRERLYLETVEEVLKTVSKTLIDSKVNVLPLLDLSKLDTTDRQTSSPIPTPTKP